MMRLISHVITRNTVQRDVVRQRRQIIRAVGERDDLVVVPVLPELLEAGVEVPEMGDHPDHGLTVQLDHQSEHAVRGGVLRPDVDEHVLGGDAGLLRHAERHPQRLTAGIHTGGGELELDGALAHSESGSLPRSPRRSRSFMSAGSSSYASAMDSSSSE
jgi:hypothetical protein